MQPRKAALWSSPLLWLMGVTLFLPTFRSCDKMVSPAQLMTDSPPMIAWLSPFLVAELLAILILIPALWRAQPSRNGLRISLGLVAVALASPITTVVVMLASHGPHSRADALLAGLGVVAAVAGIAVVARAWRREPWTRMMAHVAAYTLFTLPISIIAAGMLVDEGRHALCAGLATFLGAMLGLSLLTALSVRAITRR